MLESSNCYVSWQSSLQWHKNAVSSRVPLWILNGKVWKSPSNPCLCVHPQNEATFVVEWWQVSSSSCVNWNVCWKIYTYYQYGVAHGIESSLEYLVSFQCKKCFKQSCLPIKSLPIHFTSPHCCWCFACIQFLDQKNKSSFRFTQCLISQINGKQKQKKHANKKSCSAIYMFPVPQMILRIDPWKLYNGWNLKITFVEKEDQSSLSPPIVGFNMLVFRKVYGCFLKWWYPQTTPKWSFLVGKPHGCWVPLFLETSI